jgi:integrase
MSELLLDRAGRRRSPATMPGFHTGRPPRNKGLRYPADPPKVEEIVAVMRTARDGAHARRLRGLIVILWRAGLRIQEALSLAEANLDHRRGALHVRNGKGGRRREVGMDDGPGRSFARGSSCESSFRSVRCSASSTDQREAGLGQCGRPSGAAPDRRRGRRPSALRAAPAPARACRGARSRRRAADRHTAPARPQRPRHHVDLPCRGIDNGEIIATVHARRARWSQSTHGSGSRRR